MPIAKKPKLDLPPSQAAGKFGSVYVFIGLFFVLVSLLYAITSRGPWIDEYWTLWISDSSVPFGETVSKKWLLDVHPPLYPSIMYLFNTLSNTSVVVIRFINFIFALIALCITYYISPPLVRRNFVLFIAIILSAGTVEWQLSNARSYAFLVSNFIVFVMATFYVLDQREENRVSARRAAIVLPVAAVLCLNTHYIAAIHVDLFAGLAFLYAISSRNARAAVLLAASMIVANALLIGWFWLQKDFILATKDNFWIDATTLAALATIARVMMFVIPAFVVVTAVILFHKPSPGVFQGGSFEVFRVVSGPVSSVLFLVILLVINMKTPIIQDRYTITSAVALLIALFFAYLQVAPNADQTRNLATAVLCLVAIAFNVRYGLEARWDSIRNEVSARASDPRCKGIPIFYDMPEDGAVIKNQDKVFAVGYRKIFDRWSIKGEPVSTLVAHPLTTDCPLTVVYEHAVGLIRLKTETELAEMFANRFPSLRGRPIAVQVSKDRHAYLVEF